VWLGPTTNSVKQLQAALQAEFIECDSDKRPFTPHLSVGQAKTDKVADQVGMEIKNAIAEFRQIQDGSPVDLDWFVDKVYVIERKGFHDRFTVVGSIDLAQE
jgi:2'-5' RNA ligase